MERYSLKMMVCYQHTVLNMSAEKTAMLAVSKKMVEEVDNTRRLMRCQMLINLEFFEQI